MTELSHFRPIAVLDDDVQFIRMVERILKTEGTPIQPVTTPDLDEAVRVVAETDCQAALVDIYMYGEAAGFELIERMRANAATADVPLIVTSGAYQEIARRVPFLQRHGCLVLPKPFDVETLLLRLREAQEPFEAHATVGAGDEAEWSGQRRQGTWRFFINPLRRVERTA